MTSTAQPNSVIPPANSQSVAQGSQRPASYANATKAKPSPPSNGPLVVGGLETSRHAPHNSTASPVNGRPAAPPAVPSVAHAPAIVSSASIANGTPTQGDHIRKPSVTISAGAQSGYLQNGSSSGPAARPPINFGQINGAPSPNMANITPQTNPNSLSAAYTQPDRSPSPIPQPHTASGGGLPSTLAASGSVSFGQLQGSDQTLRPQGPGQHMPQQQQAQHLRRESSQSAHSDITSRNFIPANQRTPSGRGPSFPPQPQFQGQPMPYSPSNRAAVPNHQIQRQGSNTYGQRTSLNPGQSPYQARASPAMQHAQPQMMGGPMPQQYGGYHPQYMHPQQVNTPFSSVRQNSASDPTKSSTDQLNGKQPSPFLTTETVMLGGLYQSRWAHPSVASVREKPSRPHSIDESAARADFPANTQAYFLTNNQHPGMYMGHEFSQQQYGPYPSHYTQQQLPGMNYGAPPSPLPFYPNAMARPPYQQPGPQTPMSRTSSHGPLDRPSSAHPGTPSQASITPVPGSHSPAPSQPSFERPKRSQAIKIVRPDDGREVVVNKEPVAKPSPAASQGPVIVSSGAGVPSSSTPPPRAQSSTPQHARAASQQVQTAEEKKAAFQEQVKKNLEAERAEEAKKEAEKAQKEKDAAELKVKEEEAAAKAKEQAAKEKEAAEAKAAGPSAEEEAARKKKEEDEEMERMIAEMEAAEAEEEARQKAYEEKKAAEKAAKAIADKANADDELKRLEREAEAREEAKSKGGDTADTDLFAQLKKNTQFGPTAGATESGTSTPRSESPAPPVQPIVAPKPSTLKPTRPAALKLETSKPVEPAQPTAGMQSLKSARFLEIKNESVKYPEGIQSPNPSINQSARSQGRRYDKNFLLQFQPVFKEKPSIDWDKVVKDTVGDSSASAGPGSARTPSMSSRSMSNRPGGLAGGPMGQFAGSGSGPRTLPPGTTSEQRFQQASMGGAPRAGAGGIPAFGAFQGGRGGFPMAGSTGMSRTPSSQSMSGQGMNSPRNASQRGKGSRRGNNPAQENELRKKMPLTANLDIAPLETSKTGWKPASIVAPQQSQPLPGGHMAPDMVQRKVKANLNKMTPEKFEKISGDILAISSQSKDEPDGRTLRQVIQLTFEKACDEAHWASMYAKFCKRMLETMSSEIRDENVRDKNGAPVVGGALFRKYLLNRCQEEFERGWEVNLPAKPEGETEEAAMLSDDYYIAAAAKRKGLGLIQFIGELYKLNMLTLRIMHECVLKLLNFQGMPDETAVESLVKLLKTIGATLDDEPKGRQMVDQYMERITSVRDMDGLPSRVYYMLLDITDLRKKGWESKDNNKGPKTIQEIHVEAQKAAQAADNARNSAPRGGPGRPQQGRGDARAVSYGMPPPQDYQRNTVGMDDLKKLARGASNRSSGPGSLGPSSLLGGRSSSGRRGLGPMSGRGDDSGASSRTGTPPVKEKPTASMNAYDALMTLDTSGDNPDDVVSPPSTSPEATKAQPAKTESEDKA
ncbi:hypothetical protein EG328_002256 [Venturia inaequalis]|uniref:MIF4G domain-containing protein n=1 Tax=Venturia inaequalis TaxID=5025 RepID=A0A8H3VGP5_VENIN|nr:hypothetical protein EG328_002256 [Venturia inaequalis]KAE9993460.1 hypothetical protein EG327_004944 [Venturia inaequalis]RDI88737.1 hypothetical protein Vi05172_g1367 [Venturia inaequalis]